MREKPANWEAASDDIARPFRGPTRETKHGKSGRLSGIQPLRLGNEPSCYRLARSHKDGG